MRKRAVSERLDNTLGNGSPHPLPCILLQKEITQMAERRGSTKLGWLPSELPLASRF
jgi:hypothetical protein